MQLEPGQAALTGGIGFSLRRFPFVCAAFKLPPESLANMKVLLQYSIAGRTISRIYSITINVPSSRTSHPAIARWSSMVADGEWHYECLDLHQQLLASLPGIQQPVVKQLYLWPGDDDYDGYVRLHPAFALLPSSSRPHG